MKFNLERTKVIFSGAITKDGLSKSNGLAMFGVYIVESWSMVDLLSEEYDPKALKNFACRKCIKNVGEAVELDEE